MKFYLKEEQMISTKSIINGASTTASSKRIQRKTSERFLKNSDIGTLSKNLLADAIYYFKKFKPEDLKEVINSSKIKNAINNGIEINPESRHLSRTQTIITYLFILNHVLSLKGGRYKEKAQNFTKNFITKKGDIVFDFEKEINSKRLNFNAKKAINNLLNYQENKKTKSKDNKTQASKEEEPEEKISKEESPEEKPPEEENNFEEPEEDLQKDKIKQALKNLDYNYKNYIDELNSIIKDSKNPKKIEALKKDIETPYEKAKKRMERADRGLVMNPDLRAISDLTAFKKIGNLTISKAKIAEMPNVAERTSKAIIRAKDKISETLKKGKEATKKSVIAQQGRETLRKVKTNIQSVKDKSLFKKITQNKETRDLFEKLRTLGYRQGFEKFREFYATQDKDKRDKILDELKNTLYTLQKNKTKIKNTSTKKIPQNKERMVSKVKRAPLAVRKSFEGSDDDDDEELKRYKKQKNLIAHTIISDKLILESVRKKIKLK